MPATVNTACRGGQGVAGQVLYSRGDASTRFFLVLEGQVNLSLHSREGDENIIDIQGPGQVFAEAVSFMARPVYGAVAVQGRTIDVVSRARLRSHFDDAENPRPDS
jgi:CRP-like cAMP-binding protein